MSECNVDDILCQIEVLRSLKTLRQNMSAESFRNQFPELEGISEKLTENINASRANLQEALIKCGNMDLDIPEEDSRTLSSYVEEAEMEEVTEQEE